MMLRESPSRSAGVRLFGPYRLDVGDERLFREGKEIKLRRKPFAILRHLTAHPQRLVTQEEVVEAVWGKIAMSESLLRTHIAELRRVLGDDVVETVVGRGYRFLLAVEAEKPAAHAQKRVAPSLATPKLVAREHEMNVLADAFDKVLQRVRQMVFISGEPGIGKTGLVDAFLAQIAIPRGALVASGSCVEQFGAGEAYLPVLAALRAACRDFDPERIVELLVRHAPTWLAQMPALVPDEMLQALQLRVQGATQARMLRELAEALEVLAIEQPVVLVLEDIQWSDHSTMDLMALLGARREPARIFVIATCRPAELTKGDGAAKVIAQLAAHKQAFTLQLEAWSDRAIADYLAMRFPEPRFPKELATTLHRMTGGNALFTAAVVDDLESRKMIQLVEGRWQLTASTAEVESRRPDTVRQLIDVQLDRLSGSEQRTLEAASLAGLKFAAATVGFALAVSAEEIDSLCERLAGEKRFLRFVATEEWPDGTLQAHYSFVHGLYRDAALARMPTATKRIWHRRIAEGLAAAYCETSDTVAAELAMHFEEAQAVAQALQHYSVAGERAMRRFGRAEALAHFSHARALVGRLSPSAESERLELLLLKQTGPALIALKGFLDPHLEQTFARTAELARKLGDDRSVLFALLGLQRCHIMRGDYRGIEKYEPEIAEVLARLGDAVATAEAAVISCNARLFRGQLAVARAPLVEACKVLDAAKSDPARIVNAPVVGFWTGHLVVLAWLSGSADEALSAANRMLAQAESLKDPFHLSTALTITALTHMWRGEAEKTLERASAALQVARDAATPLWQARAMCLYHWAATTLEPRDANVHFEALSSNLSELLAAAPYGRTAFAPCVVEVFARAGHVDLAMSELDRVLAFVETTDERLWSADLHRLRGELLRNVDPAEAERAITRGLEIAREQGARAFELRAAISLVKFARQSKKPDALGELRRLYDSFTEGFGTGDLREAKALLDASR